MEQLWVFGFEYYKLLEAWNFYSNSSEHGNRTDGERNIVDLSLFTYTPPRRLVIEDTLVGGNT